jgi:hypothetical protein
MMKRLQMIWWLLTKKDVCVITRGDYGDYMYETTTTTKDAVTMSARLCQFCYSAMIRKEVHLNRLFNVEIPKEEE